LSKIQSSRRYNSIHFHFEDIDIHTLKSNGMQPNRKLYMYSIYIYMKSSDAKASKKMPFEIFIFHDDFYQTCIFKFSNFT